ncbi:MAG: conjugal transfer protein MobB [Flavisolibacter sp.]
MVAKITTPNTLRRALNYNEKKVQQRKAECLHAANFLLDAARMNFHQKLGRFEKQISLNERAKTNTLHISLNFDNSDKLDREKMLAIAQDYMEKIGFKEQPYLVYQHHDAGHPHVHIVTTNIQENGKRIDTFNIGRNQSAKARKDLEIKYGLIKAGEKKMEVKKEIQPFVQKLNYGKAETKRGISNILGAVIDHYKFTSLAELNAILKLYNLVADRGSEQSLIYKKNGLLYRALNEKGNRIGVPIKASSIFSKPTLSYLEERFKENEILKQEFRKALKTSIDWIMVRPPKSLQAFKQSLEKEKISLVVRQNDKGIIYGLTYIDHNTKCVFNGSDIGKDYSAKAILGKCGIAQDLPTVNKPIETEMSETNSMELSFDKNKHEKHNLSKLIDGIITPTEEYQYVPFGLRKGKRKKRKPD